MGQTSFTKTFSIKHKISLIVWLSLAGLVINSLIAFYFSRSNQNAAEKKAKYANIKLGVESLRVNYNAIRGDVLLFFILDANKEKEEFAKWDAHYKEFLSATAKIQNSLLTNDLNDSELTNQIKNLSSSVDEFVAFCEKNKSAMVNITVTDSSYGEVRSNIIYGFNPIFDKIIQNKLQLSTILDKRLETAEQEQTDRQTTSYWLIVCSILLLGIVIYYVSSQIGNQIVNPITKVRDTLNSISSGEIPEVEEMDSKDEIGEMKLSLKKLVDNLTNLKLFTQQVGQGDFSNQVTIFENQGDIATALMGMANNLKESAEMEKKRNWATEGLAEAGKLLRNDYNDVKELGNVIVSFIVKYLSANQGSFFVYLEENQNLELLACWAFDRKKFLNKTIEKGEGLVGQAYLEKEVTYLAEIPNDYLHITSGLGSAMPRNLVILPLISNEVVHGVLEIASFQVIEPYQIDFLKKFAELVASDIASYKTNAKTKELLELSQHQSEEMKSAEEELRQNMEEMQATQDEMARKQKEAADAIERFELVADVTTEGLWDMSVPSDLNIKENTPFYWAAQFRRMLGYKDETDFPNILSSWSSLLHPDHKQKTLDAFGAHLMDYTGQIPYDVQYQLKLKNGTYKWFRAIGKTLRDANGKPLRVAGSLIDIELQKQVEAMGIKLNTM